MKTQKLPHSRKPRAAAKSKPRDDHPKPSPKPSTKPPSSSAAAARDDPWSASAGPSAAPPPPGPGGPLLPPPQSPRPQPTPYGFHNLERRTIVLADGSVRSYFALPPDLPPDPASNRFLHFPAPHGGRLSPEGFRGPPPPYGRGDGPQQDYWSSLGLDGPRGPPEGLPSLKRKYGEEDDLMWHRPYGNLEANPGGFRPHSPLHRDLLDDLRPSKHAKVGGEDYDELNQGRGRGNVDAPPVAIDVDHEALSRAFLKFSKAVNEDVSVRKSYFEDGKNGPLRCLACSRTTKEFADVHELIMHAYTLRNADLRVDHLGFHKALCVLMGWDYTKLPDSSKAYQSLSTDAAIANRENLILWPPIVMVHNTNLGRRRDGRMEGMGNKEMDNKLKELGFGGGKSKSIYGKDGHAGLTLVKFANNQSGLKDAERLAEYFEKDNHGRRGWACVEALHSSDDDGKNPALVKVDEKMGEEKRILYGYLATASDLVKVDFETRKKAIIKSRREHD